jgi:hypothetical protein
MGQFHHWVIYLAAAILTAWKKEGISGSGWHNFSRDLRGPGAYTAYQFAVANEPVPPVIEMFFTKTEYPFLYLEPLRIHLVWSV